MNKMLACWRLTDTPEGLSVIYVNMLDGLQHDCGVVRRDTLPILLLEFIAEEGDPGDVVVWNGEPVNYLMKEVRA